MEQVKALVSALLDRDVDAESWLEFRNKDVRKAYIAVAEKYGKVSIEQGGNQSLQFATACLLYTMSSAYHPDWRVNVKVALSALKRA